MGRVALKEESTRMAVYYKCKVCGEEHKSPIAFGDKKSFESSVLVGNAFQCPKTGKVAGYDKKDMFWIELERSS